ncbi:DUF5602 domain-containing protein [Pedobacter deserti]|uniref:DUF5602 domain-containing protein n=1 Tax=Pedobacter deserti TaxID=2817382 RepID=UPI002109E457|nr:DUF5602 domain-containing protein [Pedobacter sp. SYSU D00382]
MKKMLAAALIAATGLASCSKDENQNEMPRKNQIQKGPVKTVNGGQGYTWIETTPEHIPVAVGIRLSADALNEPATSIMHEGHDGVSVFELDLPQSKVSTVFDHVTVDWNPHGHPPENVYTKAHFDFHFYMISKAERDQIPAFETDPSKFNIHPETGYLPEGYFPIPGGQAKMGVHWADPTSPELNPGGTFTQTFIYGSYDGKVNFYEPMVTREYLQTLNSKFERSIPLPNKFAKAGYYPSKMVLEKTADGYEIRLTDFVHKTKN